VVGVESPVWVEAPFIRVGRAADVGVLVESEKVFVEMIARLSALRVSSCIYLSMPTFRYGDSARKNIDQNPQQCL
jgi:hypothetical protein